ncbi:MAG TPA: type II toxin-antitoxin system HicA family toxin [Candidatus Binatia bacterium]
MSRWSSAKARQVLAALLRIGWAVKRSSGGSHKVLSREGWADWQDLVPVALSFRAESASEESRTR